MFLEWPINGKSVKMESEQFDTTLYLFGVMSKTHIMNLVRGKCIQDELNNLSGILEDWEKATKIFSKIENDEAGIADNAHLEDLKMNSKLNDIKNDPLFKQSFSNFPIEFKVVDIDELVALQRNVSLEYVETISRQIPEEPTVEKLINMCLSPKKDLSSIKHNQIGDNSFLFTSPNTDFRFLGGYLNNKLTNDDLKYCLSGGEPVSEIRLYVGYGSNAITVLHANSRLVLKNGFHRVYALRKQGITKIPVVVEKIGNPDIDLPQKFSSLSRDYLLKDKRPVMVKDFFVNGITTILRYKKMLKSLRVKWSFDQVNIPI